MPAGSVTNRADCPNETLRLRRCYTSTAGLPGPADGSQSAAIRSYLLLLTLCTVFSGFLVCILKLFFLLDVVNLEKGRLLAAESTRFNFQYL